MRSAEDLTVTRRRVNDRQRRARLEIAEDPYRYRFDKDDMSDAFVRGEERIRRIDGAGSAARGEEHIRDVAALGRARELALPEKRIFVGERQEDGSYTMRRRVPVASREERHDQLDLGLMGSRDTLSMTRKLNRTRPLTGEWAKQAAYNQKSKRMLENRRLDYLLNGNRAQRALGERMLVGDAGQRSKDRRRLHEAAARQHELDVLAEKNRSAENIANINARSQENIASIGARSQESIANNKNISDERIANINAQSQENVSRIGATSNENAARINAQSQERIAETNSQSQENIAGTKMYSDETIAHINAQSQENVARIGATSNENAARINAESQERIAETNRQARVEAAKIAADGDLMAAQLQGVANEAGRSLSVEQQIKVIDTANKVIKGGLSHEELAILDRTIDTDPRLSADEKARRKQELRKPDEHSEFLYKTLVDMLPAESPKRSNVTPNSEFNMDGI